jgi:hypothetical protein
MVVIVSVMVLVILKISSGSVKDGRLQYRWTNTNGSNLDRCVGINT